MRELIAELTDQPVETIQSLLEGDTTWVLRRMASDRLQCDSRPRLYPFDQCLLLTAQANFADSPEECTQVAHILWRHLRDCWPQIAQHRGFELGGRCLVSLALFVSAFNSRHGAPSAQTYRHAGVTAFHTCDRHDLATHFTQWETYLGERLT